MKGMRLPVIKKPTPQSKQLSMDDYLKFVYLNLKYIVNKKATRKAKRLLSVNIPFSLGR